MAFCIRVVRKWWREAISPPTDVICATYLFRFCHVLMSNPIGKKSISPPTLVDVPPTLKQRWTTLVSNAHFFQVVDFCLFIFPVFVFSFSWCRGHWQDLMIKGQTTDKVGFH